MRGYCIYALILMLVIELLACSYVDSVVAQQGVHSVILAARRLLTGCRHTGRVESHVGLHTRA